jgi:hypothetical protein
VHTQDGGGEAEERVRHGQADWCGVVSRRGLSHRLLRRGAAERRQPSPCLRCSCSHPCCLFHRSGENDDGSRVDQGDVHHGARYPGVVPVARPAGLTNCKRSINQLSYTLRYIYMYIDLCSYILRSMYIYRPPCSRSSRTGCL